MILFATSTVWAGGPKNTYPSPRGMDDEMNNIYHDIKNPIITYGQASSMTITQLTVSSMTVSSFTATAMTVGTSTFSFVHASTGSFDALQVGGFAAIPLIRQILQFTITAATATVITSTFVPTNLAGAITPSSTASKVLIFVEGETQNTGAGNTTKLTIFRNGAAILGTNGQNQAAPAGSSAWRLPTSMAYLDAPGSTSAQTYTVGIQTSAGTGTFCASNETCTLILVELL